jgi:opacity protein-like surface antigen
VLALAFSVPAGASDLRSRPIIPPQPLSTWSGLYGGANFGAAFPSEKHNGRERRIALAGARLQSQATDCDCASNVLTYHAFPAPPCHQPTLVAISCNDEGTAYAVTPQWSAKFEYAFLDFSDGNFFGTTASTQVHEVKVGVNYHLAPGTLVGGF